MKIDVRRPTGADTIPEIVNYRLQEVMDLIRVTFFNGAVGNVVPMGVLIRVTPVRAARD